METAQLITHVSLDRQFGPCKPQDLHLENKDSADGTSELSQELQRTGQALASVLVTTSSCCQ